MTGSGILDQLAAMWCARDPEPDDLAARMQRYARAEDDLLATDWDHELLELVDRTAELVGARGLASAYTLRFTHEHVDLLLRVAADGPDARRIDGWLVPPVPISVRAVAADGFDSTGLGGAIEVEESGRFELSGLPPGVVRVRLTPRESARSPFLTPVFEI